MRPRCVTYDYGMNIGRIVRPERVEVNWILNVSSNRLSPNYAPSPTCVSFVLDN
jgi:hypothetical protein